MIDNFPVMIWRSGPNGKCDYFNNAWLEFTGRAFEQELGDGWIDGVHPEDRDRCMATFLEALEARRTFRMEYRLKRADCVYRWVADMGGPWFDQQGRFAGYSGSVQDVTEYREALSALSEGEARFRTLVENAGDIIFTLTRDGRVNYVSPNAPVKTGYTPEEWLGRNALHGIFREDMHSFLAYFNDVFAGKSVGPSVEYRYRHRDGSYRWHSTSVTAIRDDSGGVAHYLCIARDITERKILQAEKDRAAHLAAVGELAAGLAHEINNPISAVINYAQLLLDSGPGPEFEPFIRRIMSESERVAATIRGLLSFARNDEQEFSTASGKELLDDILDLLRPQMLNEGTVIDLDVLDDLPPVWARPKQLQQVFINLLNNARYSLNRKWPDGGPDKRMRISLGLTSDESGNWLEYRFRDNGLGISSRMMKHLGQPFFTTKPPGEGTGLGLSVSLGIIREHGGCMAFDSREGAYAEVLVKIPVCQGG